MNEPQYYSFGDFSTAEPRYVYVVIEDEEYKYHCNPITYYWAKELGLTHLLQDTHLETIKHEYFFSSKKLDKNDFPYPDWLKNFYKELKEEHFYHLPYIGVFMNAIHYSSGTRNDFYKKCEIAHIITQRNLPEDMFEELYTYVFKTHYDKYQEYKFDFALDSRFNFLNLKEINKKLELEKAN